MKGLQPHTSYYPVDYGYVDELPKGWKLLPNIALFQERIDRGFVDEELLSVTIGRGVIRQKETEETKKDSSNDDKSKYKLIDVGDIAYNKMRMWQGAVGYSQYRGITSPAYIILKPKAKLNARFYHYMFRTRLYTNYSRRNSYGIADDMLSLRYEDFKRMYTIVPPVQEQNRIVEYLDEKSAQIDRFIQKKRRLIELVEEQRKEYIDTKLRNISQYATTKKPLKYVVRQLSEQVRFGAHNGRYVPLELIESWTGRILEGENVSEEFESSAKRFSSGNLLFNKLRPYLAKVWRANEEGVCSGEFLVLKPSREVSLDYLYYRLISRSFIDLVDSSTYGSKMPRASWDFIGKQEVEFPTDLLVQSRLVNEISAKEEALFELQEKYRIEIRKAEEFQNSLISHVVTGKLNVSDKVTSEGQPESIGE